MIDTILKRLGLEPQSPPKGPAREAGSPLTTEPHSPTAAARGWRR